jgi:hypothetical protein
MSGNTLQARTVFPFISPEWWETLGILGWTFAMVVLLLVIMIGTIAAAAWSVEGNNNLKKKIRSKRRSYMTRSRILMNEDGTFLPYKGGDDGLEDWASVEQRLINEGISSCKGGGDGGLEERWASLEQRSIDEGISNPGDVQGNSSMIRHRKRADGDDQQRVRRYVEESESDDD